MPRLPAEILKDILLGAAKNSVRDAAFGGLISGGVSAIRAPEGERGEEFLHGAGRGAAIGAVTGLLSGGLGAGLGGRSPSPMDQWLGAKKLIRSPEGEMVAKVVLPPTAWRDLSPQVRAAIITEPAVELAGGTASALMDWQHGKKKEGGVMLKTWLNKLAESEMSEKDRRRGLNGMTLDELEAVLHEKREKTADLGATLVERGGAEKVADYSPELMQQLQNPEIQQAFRQSGAVLDPQLMPIEDRHVMAVAPTMEEHVEKQRAEGGKAMGGLATLPGSVAGVLGGGTAGHALQGLLNRRAGKTVGELAARSHFKPLEIGGALLGAGLGSVGGYHIGKPLGAALSGHAAAKDSPEMIQQIANVELANKLYHQGMISRNEMVGAEGRYDKAMEGEPELPKTALQQFAVKLASASEETRRRARKGGAIGGAIQNALAGGVVGAASGKPILAIPGALLGGALGAGQGALTGQLATSEFARRHPALSMGAELGLGGPGGMLGAELGKHGACAKSAKSTKKSALKKVSGGQEFGGADSIKTAGAEGAVLEGLLSTAGGALAGGGGGAVLGAGTGLIAGAPGHRREAMMRGGKAGLLTGAALGGIGGAAGGGLWGVGGAIKDRALSGLERFETLAEAAGAEAKRGARFRKNELFHDIPIAQEAGNEGLADALRHEFDTAAHPADVGYDVAEQIMAQPGAEALRATRRAGGRLEHAGTDAILGSVPAGWLGGGVAGAVKGRGPEPEKTASLKSWVVNRLNDIEKNAGFLDRVGALIGGAAKKAVPVAKQVAEKAAPSAEELASKAAQHAKEMEGMRAMARAHGGGGPGSMLTGGSAARRAGAGHRAAMGV